MASNLTVSQLIDPGTVFQNALEAVDEEQAALDRTRERTLRESRSGVEVPPVEAAPVVDSLAGAAPPPSAEVLLYEQPEPSGDCDYNELSGRVLSVVGSLVSFETSSGWYCRGTAHDGAVASFSTVDLETGDAVDIRSLVPETAIVAGIGRGRIGL